MSAKLAIRDPQSIRRILLFRFSSLGDVLMFTPLIRAAKKRFPNATIDVVVREDFADLLLDNPYISCVLAFPRSRSPFHLVRFAKRLNASPYDLIYDGHRSLRSRIVLPMLVGGEKLTFPKRYLRRALTLGFKLPLLPKNQRMIERFIEPLEAWGIEYDGGGPEFFVDELLLTRALKREKLDRKSVRPVRVAVVPSAQWEGKRWPVESFRAVALRARKEMDAEVWVLGGAQDDACDEMMNSVDDSEIKNLRGRFTLREVGAVLSTCDAVVANDTGLMHLADAVGVPSVGIFGPTGGELGCLPFHPQAQVCEKKMWCRPCSKNGQGPCIRGKRVCLLTIQPEEVYEALCRALSPA